MPSWILEPIQPEPRSMTRNLRACVYDATNSTATGTTKSIQSRWIVYFLTNSKQRAPVGVREQRGHGQGWGKWLTATPQVVDITLKRSDELEDRAKPRTRTIVVSN